MRYCLNPHCPNPRNPDDTEICYSCSTKLLLNDRYHAIKLIGQGGFGRTFLAADNAKPSQPRCVIKQFYPDEQTNARAAMQLFEQEAQRLKQLGEHPQIPDFYDHLEQDKHQYIIQEFIDGQNLSQELATNGTFNQTQIKTLLKDLLPVLKFIHAGQIIHRDIKPDNIIRSRQQELLYLVDFGAAKYATATALAQTGTVIGSAEFIAPEQLRGKATFASDIYSLGVTCIYLLTQVSPFNLFDITENVWVWKDYLVDNLVSDDLGQILDKMINNSLKERYHSVDEIMTDLKIGQFTEKLSHISLAPATQKWQCIHTLTGHSQPVTSMAFNPLIKQGEEGILASGGADWTIKLWSLKTGQEIDTLIGHTDKITAIAFSPDGRFLASSSCDRSIRIYHLQRQSLIHKLLGHTNWVSSIAFSPNSRLLASGSFDKTIKIWNVQSGKQLENFVCRGYMNWVKCLAFHPFQSILASGNGDNSIYFFDLHNKSKEFFLIGHIHIINSLAFSPDGQVLASASDDKTVKIWSLDTRKVINNLSDYLVRANTVAFSPDGKILAAGKDDNTIKLWYLEQKSWQLVSEDAMMTLTGHSDSVTAVAFSPNGQLLASGSVDGSIKLWQCGTSSAPQCV
ncbi:serine/threonine-protein kinase [Gloeothece verrucosa]|uniref:Serine/threonine-protein kinase-like domain protein n=1 Tax=Gloeothece verrucosa (strain PCC 7822) TaxID=497965 RepID=E0U5X6_GLOV7|nr:serine/threonine-protein kinase [Gloeothece verrucosa]ADN17085.1 Serine/threonine-protein kinase-like domain protein [Gloeothece verrucosa PCC 7822]